MLIIPAIDLKDGQCVRLRQGLMEDSTVFGDSPVNFAKQWVDQGCRRLHLVDLNGAFEGEPVNAAPVEAILAQSKTPAQLGGGIRDMATIERWLDKGLARVILGTVAVENPALVREASKAFPGQVAVGIDARNGRVATKGWAEETDVMVTDLAKSFEDAGVAAIIYTDINRDGMMGGINLPATLALSEIVEVPIIASGGVNTLSDIEALVKLPLRAVGGIQGVITGRAIYEGTMDLREAITLSQAP